MLKIGMALVAILMSGFIVPDFLRAEEGKFFRILADLDEPRGYCLDIPGHKSGANPEAPLQAHTCKYGIWHLDELFHATPVGTAPGQAAKNVWMLRMPHYELCVVARKLAEESPVGLERCASLPGQMWIIQSDGRISPSRDGSYCLTVADEPGHPAGPFGYVIRDVHLTRCSQDALERQRWTFMKAG